MPLPRACWWPWARTLVQNAENDNALACDVNITITEDMDAPVYVYYELTGFYQNHRRCVMQACNMAAGHMQRWEVL